MTKKKIIIGYKRTAGEDPTGDILKKQESEIVDLCRKEGFTIDAFFEDNGVSGSNFERRGWSALKDFIIDCDGMVKYIVVADYNRIGRNAPAVVKEIENLKKKYGIKVLAAQKSKSAKWLIKGLKMEHKGMKSRKNGIK